METITSTLYWSLSWVYPWSAEASKKVDDTKPKNVAEESKKRKDALEKLRQNRSPVDLQDAKKMDQSFVQKFMMELAKRTGLRRQKIDDWEKEQAPIQEQRTAKQAEERKALLQRVEEKEAMKGKKMTKESDVPVVPRVPIVYTDLRECLAKIRQRVQTSLVPKEEWTPNFDF